MQTEFCPLCSKDGRKVRITAYQLNLEEAVFMCSTEECTWPVGYHELLFMDRPMGMYKTKDWPEVADRYLANHLQKQRDSLSELSVYTPPQTPGNCKDAVPDINTANHSALPVYTLEDLLQPQPSTSESKDFEPPVIDLVGETMPSFENKVVSFVPTVGPKLEKILVIKKDSSGIKITSKNTNTAVVANPFAKHSVTVVDNKPIDVKENKACFGMSERNVASDSVQNKRFRIIGRKTKSFTYKKQFDIFDDIKKAKSTNEQCSKAKATIAIKSKIDLDKMKPNEIKEVLFVNSKANLSKVESNVNKGIKLEVKQELVKGEKKVFKVLKTEVNNSSVGVEKDKAGVDSLIKILDSDSNASAESLSKLCSIDERVQNDLDVAMQATQVEFESNESWSESEGLDSLLAMLEKSPPDSSMTTNDQMNVDAPIEAMNVNATLLHETLNCNVILPSEPSNCNTSTSNATLSNELPNCNNALTSNITLSAETMNDNLSNSNVIFPSEPSEEKKINNDEGKDEKMVIEPVNYEMDLDDNDTLECTIDESEDPLFAGIFSPPMNQ